MTLQLSLVPQMAARGSLCSVSEGSAPADIVALASDISCFGWVHHLQVTKEEVTASETLSSFACLEKCPVQDFENDALQCTHLQSDLALQMVLHLESMESARCKHLQA